MTWFPSIGDPVEVKGFATPGVVIEELKNKFFEFLVKINTFTVQVKLEDLSEPEDT